MQMFKENDFVFIKTERVKAVVKAVDVQENRFRCTYFSNGKRQVNWFKFEDLKPWTVKPKQTQRKRDTLLFAKVTPTAIIPSRRNEDGCYDIYADQSIERVVIEPNQIVEVATGIASAFSSRYRLDFQRERGSTGSIGLVPRCGQVDSGYRGQIFLKLQNVTNKTIILSRDIDKTIVREKYVEYPITKAVCQAALEFVPNVDVVEIPYETLEKIPSERGKGKLGDSGK